MSTTHTNPQPRTCHTGDTTTAVEIITARDVPLGGPRAMTVHRTLPQRRRGLIGAWCFIDHYGPDPVAHTGGMDVPPHPHTGLQTVSWLFEGELIHDDAHGIHAHVRPGEVNLMTAGAGTCHSEVSTPDTTTLHGVQLWTVLPEHARSGPRRFDHYAPTPTPFEGGTALVFIGSLLGAHSPIPTFTPLLGADITLNPTAHATIPINPSYEHGILLDQGTITVNNTPLAPTELAYTGTGTHTLHLHNTAATPARLILLGGTPFTEEIVMWWNFIGRSDEEIRHYQQLWNQRDPLFGDVGGYQGHDPNGPSWLPAPPLPTATMKTRTPVPPTARPGADPYAPRT